MEGIKKEKRKDRFPGSLAGQSVGEGLGNLSRRSLMAQTLPYVVAPNESIGDDTDYKGY
jgi:hypothetical protein